VVSPVRVRDSPWAKGAGAAKLSGLRANAAFMAYSRAFHGPRIDDHVRARDKRLPHGAENPLRFVRSRPVQIQRPCALKRGTPRVRIMVVVVRAGPKRDTMVTNKEGRLRPLELCAKARPHVGQTEPELAR
jgi:hypothetical protein